VTAGLFSLLLAVSEGQSWGWTASGTLALLAVAGLSLAVFAVVELSVHEPLLDVRVFRHWQFVSSLLLIATLAGGLFAGLYYVPVSLQEAEGIGALQTGLILLPSALVTAVMMPVAGRIYDRAGPRWPVAAGALLVAAGTYMLHSLTLGTPKSEVVLWMCLRNLGLGLALMPAMTGGLACIPPALVSRASAINNVVQRVASSLGLALLTALLVGQEAQQLADRSALLPATDPGVSGLGDVVAGGPASVLNLYERTQTEVLAGAIDDLFLITALITVIGVFLGLTMRAGRP
jgi:predicted MFS family arabinose efflux permease